jgi:hypothetical protein
MDDLRVYSYALDAAAVSGCTARFTTPAERYSLAPVTDFSAIEAGQAARWCGTSPRFSSTESDFHLPYRWPCAGRAYIVSADRANPSSARTASIPLNSQGVSWTNTARSAALRRTPFESGCALYLIGNTYDGGALEIRRSDDGGGTWTTPDSGTSGVLPPTPAGTSALGALAFRDGARWGLCGAARQHGAGASPFQLGAGAISTPGRRESC